MRRRILSILLTSVMAVTSITVPVCAAQDDIAVTVEQDNTSAYNEVTAEESMSTVSGEVTADDMDKEVMPDDPADEVTAAEMVTEDESVSADDSVSPAPEISADDTKPVEGDGSLGSVTVYSKEVTANENPVTVSGNSLSSDKISEADNDQPEDQPLDTLTGSPARDGAAGQVTLTLTGYGADLLNYSVQHHMSSAFNYTVDKGSTITFLAQPLSYAHFYAYETDTVTAAGRKLTPKSDTYTDGSGKQVTVNYYELANINNDTEINVSIRPRIAKDGTGFKVINEAPHCEFVKHSGFNGSAGEYKFSKGTREFAFHIKSTGSYVPKVTVGTIEGGTFVADGVLSYLDDIRRPTESYDKSKNAVDRAYYHLPAYAFDDKVIKITEEDKGVDKYCVVNTTLIEKVTARSDGRYFEWEYNPDNPQQGLFWFPLYSKVTVQVTPKSFCKMQGAYVNYAKYNLTAANEFSFIITGDSVVNLMASGIPTLYVGDEALTSGKTINKLYNSPAFTAGVYEGCKPEGQPFALTAMSALIGGKAAPSGFAVLSADKKTVTIDPTKAPGSNVTVTLKGKDANGTAFSKVFIVSVTQKSTAVTVKGFSKNVISQRKGTAVSYPVTLSGKNVDRDNLVIKASYADGSAGLPDVTFADMKLNVNTFTDESGHRITVNRPIKIQFYYGEAIDGNEVGSPFMVNPIVTAPAKPTVTVSSTSDIDAVLDLTSYKTDTAVSNLYYIVRADAVSPAAAGMKTVSTVYLKAGSTTGSVKLPLAESTVKGNGVKQRYNLSVYLVQVNDCTDDPATDIRDGNIISTGAVLKKTVDTKNPSYETAINLKARSTAFFRGQTVTLATVGFSAKTSYTDFNAYIDGTGLDPAYINGNNIVLDSAFTEGLAPGKHTLMVQPSVKGAVASQKTLAFTVKQRIDSLGISLPSVKVYKAENKAAALTVTALFNPSGSPAPASKKVKWALGDKDGNPFAPGDDRAKFISISGGKVTINKGFILSARDDENYFTVIVSADDFAGNDVSAVSEPVFISNAYLKIGKLSVKRGGSEVAGAQGSQIAATSLFMDDTDLKGSEVSKSLIFKSNKPADFGFDPDTGFFAKKPGKYTLTVTANDGGKNSKSIVFQVFETIPNSYKLYAVQADDENAVPTDAFGSGNTITVNPNKFIILEPVVMGINPGDFYTKPIIKSISAARLVKKIGDRSVYSLTGKEMKVVVKTLTGDMTYFVKAEQTVMTGKLKNLTQTINSGSYRDPFSNMITFDLLTEGLSDGSYDINVRKDATGIVATGSAKMNYDNFYSMFGGLTSITVNNNKARINLPAAPVLYSGTYRFNACLTRTEAGKVIPITNSALLTFTVKALGFPSAGLKSTYKLDKVSGASDVIQLTSAKNIGVYNIYPVLYNVNRSGIVNDFADYFELTSTVVDENRTWYLKLKDGVSPLSVKTADMTGYIRYSYGNRSYYGELDKARYTMVTVKWK